ncbi:cadherin-like protein 26 [Microcebus murinus]|uniref:cadherin-like protein 26 n=1 Tax=Microcebus murinus TaxID=30608 RepID=UPI003F6C7CB5
MNCKGHSSLLLLLLPVLLGLLQREGARAKCPHGAYLRGKGAVTAGRWHRHRPHRRHCHCNSQGERHGPLRRTKRRWVITTLELEEEDPGPFPKFVGELFNNMSENRTLMYLISGPGVDEYPEIGLFSIEDHKNGKIYVHRSVDRETTPSFMVCFDAVDRSTGEIVDRSLIFNVRIRDVNDHAPQFPEKEFYVSVKENQAAGQPIFQVLAVDLDQENTPNSQVLYFLVSQTPLLKESGFRIDRISGEIKLSGCLDYETAAQFTLVIRAQDGGEPSLSSTATVHIHVQDGNNHLPTFARENYKIQISEGQVTQGLLRLPVQDRDSPGTAAWRAQFNILHGNEEGHFDVLADPETNEGILNVIKPLDHESRPVRSLVISVENEEPLFSCQRGELRQPRGAAASATVSVQVADANDPPAFHPESVVVSLEEGARPGTPLGTLSAIDPDGPASQMRYELVRDPADWVAVDENSGAVITRGPIDRESPHVNDSFYTIVVLAVDSGVPPQTGTGTLMLFLSDVNDNAPTLQPGSRDVEVCESAGNEPLRIEADDPDLEPYSDPFTFELDDTVGNAEDMWRLGKNWGRSVELFMSRSLPRGDYLVPLVIADRQGVSQKQTVHVRICSCPSGIMCAELSHAGAELVRALAPVCAAFSALAVALLLLLRCYFAFQPRRRRCSLDSDTGQQTLIVYNDESKAPSAQVAGRTSGKARLHLSRPRSSRAGERGDEMRAWCTGRVPVAVSLTAVSPAVAWTQCVWGKRRPWLSGFTSAFRNFSRSPFLPRVPQTQSDVRGQMWALPTHTAVAGARLSAKGLGDLPPSPAAPSDRVRLALGTPGCVVLFEPRGVENKHSTPVYPGGAVPRRRLAPVGGRIAEMLRQKLRGVDAREDDTDCQPRAYLEEGRSAGAPSLSSPAVSEQGLPPDLLDGLGWKAAALADTDAERGVSSSDGAYFGELAPFAEGRR